MRLGQPTGAVVGADMPVDVDEPDRVRMGVDMLAGESGHQLAPGPSVSELGQPTADL